MQLSETVKLYLTKDQKALVLQTMDEYICTVNSLVSDAMNGAELRKYSSADVKAELPSAIRNQCIRDAKSIIRKYQKAQRKANDTAVPVLRKPCCYINNQNFRLTGGCIEFSVMMSGKSKRMSVRIKMTERQRELFERARFGTMRIVFKGDKIVAQIV
ncbi:MAG: hypothetical protein IJ120_00005, partial [Solobacterium sp.]|nr:hypothetical protein [Solobacterium sp.]